MHEPARRRVAVIGGGISGLAAAHRVLELDPRVELTLIEASRRLGGVLETVCESSGEGEFLIERSADSFITNVPWAAELCRRVGLVDELIATNDQFRRALVAHRGRLMPLPDGFLLMAPGRLWPVLTTPLLSPWGKLRLLGEYFVPRRKERGDESLASFARRRLGREAYERLVQPLVGGIYTADPERLSLAATLPRFLEMERSGGGLIRAARRQSTDQPIAAEGVSGARYSMFVAPKRGLSSLVAAIAARLPARAVRLGTQVESIAKHGLGWRLSLSDYHGQQEHVECDAVILAVPAHSAAALLTKLDASLAADLGGIEYAGTTIVSVGYRRDQVAHPLDAFGFVVPLIAKRRLLAGSFASVKFAGRAPAGKVLIRVFVGGACQSELADLPNGALERLVSQELGELLGVQGAPLVTHIARWPRSMPQYHVGHCELVQRIERRAAELVGLELAGNAYRGVGIPHCIHSGETAAERALQSCRGQKSAVARANNC